MGQRGLYIAFNINTNQKNDYYNIMDLAMIVYTSREK